MAIILICQICSIKLCEACNLVEKLKTVYNNKVYLYVIHYNYAKALKIVQFFFL